MTSKHVEALEGLIGKRKSIADREGGSIIEEISLFNDLAVSACDYLVTDAEPLLAYIRELETALTVIATTDLQDRRPIFAMQEMERIAIEALDKESE